MIKIALCTAYRYDICAIFGKEVFNMKRKNIRMGLVLLAILSVSFSNISGQTEGEKVKYTPDFRFQDGIYLNFDQVKANSPIPKAKLLTSAD